MTAGMFSACSFCIMIGKEVRHMTKAIPMNGLMIREMFRKGDIERDAGLTSPEDVERFDDIQYGTDCPKWQMLDVYRPKGSSGKLPVIVSVHGGAWVYGDKDVYQYYCMSLAQRGFAVVNFSYRLAPEYKYPASFEDVNAVCEWITANAERYGLDTDNVFAVGDSAGAHMLALYCCACTNEEYAAATGYAVQKDLRFRAIALNCGAFLIETHDGDMTTAIMDEYLPEGGTAKELEMISPLYHINGKFPPAFIMTCPGDFLNSQPIRVIPVLEKLEIPFVYRRYGSAEDKLGHVFHCNMRLDAARLCNDEEAAFFRTFIK